ncbi:hypothetical protein KP77_30200 [Jeotgalibacillus alimentarius]|uniref:Uncharacterized protein n=1 Tax=Jeotgalibacillus alimentarius TaxID=135826 RepID=A0A0C2VHV6_9BACL|nr:hypothetical protein KP77_30200 [Jeotgalibacillus alimentarius]
MFRIAKRLFWFLKQKKVKTSVSTFEPDHCASGGSFPQDRR